MVGRLSRALHAHGAHPAAVDSITGDKRVSATGEHSYDNVSVVLYSGHTIPVGQCTEAEYHMIYAQCGLEVWPGHTAHRLRLLRDMYMYGTAVVPSLVDEHFPTHVEGDATLQSQYSSVAVNAMDTDCRVALVEHAVQQKESLLRTFKETAVIRAHFETTTAVNLTLRQWRTLNKRVALLSSAVYTLRNNVTVKHSSGSGTNNDR